MARKTLLTVFVMISAMLSASCSPAQVGPTSQAGMPDPASVHCEQNGGKQELRQDASGGVAGICVLPDGSTFHEWDYYRGECGPTEQIDTTPVPTEIPTALPIDPVDYQGRWTSTQPPYNSSIMLPKDWIAEEVITADPLMNGHALTLRSRYDAEKESVRMTFERLDEDVRLWPMGVG